MKKSNSRRSGLYFEVVSVASGVRPQSEKIAAGCYTYGNILVAGMVYAPDSYTIPIVSVHWIYKGVKQGAKKIKRIGILQ